MTRTTPVLLLLSLGIGLLTAVTGALVGGWLASRAVDWYQVSSREGGSGYFIAYLGLLAGIVGLVTGVLVGWMVMRGGGGFFISLLYAHLAHLALIGAVAGLARLMADVPPAFQGEGLMLAVEVSWPVAQAPTLPTGTALPHVTLHATDGETLRVARDGPLWIEDARVEEGRLVVPGAVEIFTSRGKRLLFFDTGKNEPGVGFEVPLPAYPGQAQRAWSRWLPQAREGAPALPDGMRYRFRVVKRSEPIRSTVVGPFTIETVARGFGTVQYGNEPLAAVADAVFRIRYQGNPVTLSGPAADMRADDSAPPENGAVEQTAQYTEITGVAVIPGTPPALVVQVDAPNGYGDCYLLREAGGAVRSAYLSYCHSGIKAFLLSGAGVEQAPRRGGKGVIDTRMFATPGLYLFERAVVDTRPSRGQVGLRRMSLKRSGDMLKSLAPLGLAPDEQRFARLGRRDSRVVVEEVDIASGTIRDVSATAAVVPTGRWEDVGRVWFEHYFAWERDPSGTYRIAPRANVQRMPYQGTLQEEPGYREYRIAPVSAALRDTLIEVLVKELGASRVPTPPDAYAKALLLDGQTLHLGYGDGHVGIWVDRETNTEIVVKVARVLDAALATRRFDQHFLQGE